MTAAIRSFTTGSARLGHLFFRLGAAAAVRCRSVLRVPLWGKVAGANLIIVLVTLAALDWMLPNARYQLGVAMAWLLAAGLLLNLALVGLALRPLRELEATASRVLRGDLEARVLPSALADRDMLRVGGAINLLLDGLTADRARSRQLAVQVISAQDQERARIAGELHESSAQTLTALVLQLSAAMRDEPNPALAARLEEIRAMAVEALEELRRLSETVHSRVLDDLGLVAALEWLARRARAASVVGVDVDASGDAAVVPHPTASVLYRVAQEALSNAIRHAHPTAVHIAVDATDTAATLRVHDDGAGFDIEEAERRRPGMGLFSMRERVALVNGTLEISSALGAGTLVHASIPLTQPRTP
jgi:signal transduction histidine kinase